MHLQAARPSAPGPENVSSAIRPSTAAFPSARSASPMRGDDAPAVHKKPKRRCILCFEHRVEEEFLYHTWRACKYQCTVEGCEVCKRVAEARAKQAGRKEASRLPKKCT